MNIVFFVVLLLLLGGGVKGYKRGMVEELNKAVALILSLAAIAMFIFTVKGYLDHETVRTVLGIVCLTIAVLVYRITDFVLSSLRMISSAPVIRGVNKLLGLALGAAEGVVLVWAVFIVIVAFEFGGVSSFILDRVRENPFLVFLFRNNYLARLMSSVLPAISAFAQLEEILSGL